MGKWNSGDILYLMDVPVLSHNLIVVIAFSVMTV